jgi:metallophosphoesterase superfamily enzyme
MSHIYIHLSDIHFGQEKGGDLYIHDDIKEQILTDAREYVIGLKNEKADGVIVSGDIAYAGKQQEYVNAGKWLDRLTAAVGCDVTNVQVVPGNHDIDREKITAITQTFCESKGLYRDRKINAKTGINICIRVDRGPGT